MGPRRRGHSQRCRLPVDQGRYSRRPAPRILTPGVRALVRVLEPELIDQQSLDPAELDRSLGEVWQVNRYLGGNALLKGHLSRMLQGARGRVSLLDVATGSADIPLALLDWGRRRGLDLAVTAVDINPQMVELARRRTAGAPAIRIAQADGRRLPYPDAHFDVAMCNLALHHLDDAGAADLLREMDRVSRVGWVVADLERRTLAYWGARLLARVVWRSPLTRHDGPLSVRRAFTAAEVRRLVGLAGVSAEVHRHFPFLLAVVRRG